MVADLSLIDRQILSKNRLLSQLESQEMIEFLACCAVQRFAPEETIFSKGDPGDSFYAILRGRVGIVTISEEGREILLNILDEGNVFGEIAVLDGKERTASAVAMQVTDLVVVGRNEFVSFLESHPKLCIRLMTVLCERLRWTSDIIEDTVFLQIPHRLAKRLLTLAGTHGMPYRSGVKLTIRLSQEELGHMLGATRESVNKGLRSLQAKGVLCYHEGYIVIPSPTALREIAMSPEPH